MYVEEISLSASVDALEADRPSEEKTTLATLEQANWMRRCQAEFTLFNDHSLSVDMQGILQKPRNYTIDIGILDPQPRRALKICWVCFLSFFVLCGAAWFFAFISLAQKAALMSMILGACAGISLVLAIYRSHDRVVFYSQSGRVPLVVLFNRLPNRATLGSFSDALVQQIKCAKNRYLGRIEALNAELKVHRQLMEDGVISNKRYGIVKQRILSQHGDRSR